MRCTTTSKALLSKALLNAGLACLLLVLSGCETALISDSGREAEEPPAAEPEVIAGEAPGTEPLATPEQLCPPPEQPEVPECPEVKPKKCPVCPALVAANKMVLGEVERVTVTPPGVSYLARIDTGAEGTSIHATDVVRFERDGDRWVRFSLDNPDNGEPVVIERELLRRVRVRQAELEDWERRLVVMLTFSIGDLEQQIEVSLTDRASMEYPVLIGRNFLRNVATVDVSQRMIVK